MNLSFGGDVLRDVARDHHLPLLCFLVAFLLGFLGIRVSVRLIRAQVRWWPGNVTPGGLHVHHVVFGTLMVLSSGLAMVAVAVDGSQTTMSVLAAIFGVGAALVLDEFALILHLRDVYWTEEGRASVDAIFVAVAITGLLLLGFGPLEFLGVTDIRDSPDNTVRLAQIALSSTNVAIAVVVLLKGKLWTGLFGLYLPVLLWVGAIRLARPGSPWARWRYTSNEKRMARALGRERRWRRPVVQAKIYLQDLVSGRPDAPAARAAARNHVERVVTPAPAPVTRAESDRTPISG